MAPFFFLAAPTLLRLMGAEGELARMAAAYLRVYAICSPLTTIIFAVDNFLRICGQIRTSMVLNIFMSVLSGLLEFVFLFVFRFGIWAAAAATCSGMMITSLIAFYPFFRGKTNPEILPSKISHCAHQAHRALRQSQLFEQYCRKDYLDLNEYDSSAHGRPCGGRLRNFNVCRWFYPASSIRYVRLPAAGSGI